MCDEKKDAYLTVLNDLMECDLFVGRYDARNGNRHFMRGICTVMEFIAIQAGVENLTDVFYDNMQKSEEKVEEKRSEAHDRDCKLYSKI